MTNAILLYKGNSFVDRLIQWQTRSPYSHAVIKNDGIIWESYPGVGVRERKFNQSDTLADAFVVRGITDNQWEKAIDYFSSQKGKPYDWAGDFRFLTREPGTIDGKWFCSEIVYECLNQAGFPLLSRIECWGVSPALLALSPFLIPAP